ncbi:MAG: MATE family efflux transporter [Pirellulaceae bacterium]|jgi:putative MATE family efflux protein|nr:MATE family efflux transporter [Pirellulaceae bacterium]
MDRAERLGRGSIVSLLLTFSAPAVVGMLAQALYNVVDRVFVGQAVGPLGIAGTTLAFPFMLIQMAFSMLIGFGAAALVSLRLGEKRKDEAEQVLGHALLLLIVASVLLTAGGLWLLDPLLRLVGSSEQSHPFARDYLQVIVAGAVFQCLGFGLNAVIRGEGNPRVAMLTMLIGALLNTLLDPFFLFVLGWGVRGAALATVLSQFVSAVWVVGYFLRGRSLLKIRLHHLRLRGQICARVVAAGSPMFAMQLAASVMNGILNNQLKTHGGDLAISVMGIIHSVALFIAMPIFGLNQGAQPIIGYNYGARKYDRVLRTLELAVLFASLVCLAGFLVVMLAPGQVIAVFNRTDPQLRELGTRALRICLVTFPIVGFQIVGSSYFQAVGKPRHALLLGLSRQVLLLIPAILILPAWLGLDGVWLAIPTADFCASVLTGVWLFAELRHLRDRHGSGVVTEIQPTLGEW